jgi:hypothetical protein
MNNEKLIIGTKIQVHGWIMLKGLNQGLYKILSQDNFSYTFSKINGKKAICRHYINSIHNSINCYNRGDNNGIQVI